MKIVELHCADLASAVRFIISEIKAFRGEDVDFEEMYNIYSWLFVDNPWRKEDFIGWGLVDAEGELRGTHLICWEKLSRGVSHLRVLVSTNSYVHENYRGPLGLGLMLNMRKRNGVDVCICTTANVNSGSIWKSLKAKVLSHSDKETIIGMNAVGLVCEKFASRGNAFFMRFLSRSLSSLRRITRRKLTRKYECMQILEANLDTVVSPVNTDVYGLDRSSEYLRWRYFRHPQHHTMLYRITNGCGDECYVGVCLRKRGKVGLVCGYILDVFGQYKSMNFESILASIDEQTNKLADFYSLRLHVLDMFYPVKHWLNKSREMEFPTHWGLCLNKDISTTDCSLMMSSGDAVV